MPTYEYKCEACGHTFEQMQSIKADPIKKCPVCKKQKVKRLISMGAGLIFKGSGFYITDYRDAGYKDSAKADAPPAAASTTGDAPKGESAGDSKPSKDSDSKPAASANSKQTAQPESKPAAKSEAPPRSPKKSR